MYRIASDYNISLIKIAVVKMYASGLKPNVSCGSSYFNKERFMAHAKKIVDAYKAEQRRGLSA